MMKILVTTDFSDTAKNAVRYAVQLSSQFREAEIILYHSYSVLHLSGIPMPVLPEDTTTFRRSVMDEMSKLVEGMEDITPATTRIHCETDVLPLIEGMQEIIDVRGIDLVIMGITGKGALGKTLIGSNTLAATTRISLPVIIVPADASWVSVNKILFAYNREQALLSSQSLHIHKLVTTLAAHLEVLYIGDEQPGTGVRQELQRLLQLNDISYHTIQEKRTAKEILQFAETAAANLVLALPGKYGFVEDLFHKSVTKELAYSTKIPLVVIGQ
ncbi:universal stress protein [Chitinophaga sp. Cy-1792]|uniref:universal stress protein n=1 Tax=Chitinophaga sp. Cy-1792 TaxID=2608339 RepID=UPI001423B04F|nr:universal stress protein [Chitinophaga sp. Cy-1792]NIG56452.1 universal stress protein [Chitinophaga sp. Cy-1792]